MQADGCFCSQEERNERERLQEKEDVTDNWKRLEMSLCCFVVIERKGMPSAGKKFEMYNKNEHTHTDALYCVLGTAKKNSLTQIK